MKKKFLLGLALIASVSVTLVNFYQTNRARQQVVSLTLSDVETLTENETNPWHMWFSQGFTKDEREYKVACKGDSKKTTTSVTVTTKSGTSVNETTEITEPVGEYKITCPYGEQNCTETDC